MKWVGLSLVLSISLLVFWGVAAQAQTTPERRIVLVALAPLERGTILTEGQLYGAGAVVEARLWPSELVPETAITQLSNLEGAVLRLDLAAGMPILAGAIGADLTTMTAVGSDTALLIPQGLLGVPIPVGQMAYAPLTMDVLSCVTVEGIFNFGGISSRYRVPLGAPGIVIEGVLGSGLVTIALEPEAAASVVWAADNGFDFWLDFATADCPAF